MIESETNIRICLNTDGLIWSRFNEWIVQEGIVFTSVHLHLIRLPFPILTCYFLSSRSRKTNEFGQKFQQYKKIQQRENQPATTTT